MSVDQHHMLHGLLFRIEGEFPDTEAGTREANEYLEDRADLGVLAVTEGRIIIASITDRGYRPCFEWWTLRWADGISREVWAPNEARARALGETLMEREAIDHGDIVRAYRTAEGV